MTGHHGASPPGPLVAPGRAAERSMERGKELAPAGGSSAGTVESSPTRRKSVKRREGEAEGGKKKKMREAVEDPLDEGYWCNVCWKVFPTVFAAWGHMGNHAKRGEEVELSTEEVQKRKIRMTWDLNKEPTEDVKNDDEDFGGEENQPQQLVEEVTSISLDLGQIKLDMKKGSETKCDGGSLAEGGASSSAVEALRKKIPVKLDLNKKPPEDVENDDEDYGGDNKGAYAGST